MSFCRNTPQEKSPNHSGSERLNFESSRAGVSTQYSFLGRNELGGHSRMSPAYWQRNVLFPSKLMMNYPAIWDPHVLVSEVAIYNLFKRELRPNLVFLNVLLANKALKAPIQRHGALSLIGLHALSSPESIWLTRSEAAYWPWKEADSVLATSRPLMSEHNRKH